MKDKGLDILELMRESISQANKQLGFTKPQLIKESVFEEEFDPNKHMPKFEVSKNWGTSGTLEANQIDAIIAPLIDSKATNGLERYKEAVGKLNAIFGEAEKKEGELATAAQAQATDVTRIISSLQLKNIIHAIINNKDAQTAGKLYELLMARIAGGFTPAEITTNIADFVDGDGNFISLKTVKQATGIKGSKFNLATAIAKKGEVKFLVCVKDQEPNTFKMNSYSFSVNKENYFNFILGSEKNVNMDLALAEMDALNKRFEKETADIQTGRKQRLGSKKSKELSISDLKFTLEDLKTKMYRVDNQKVKPAQQAFDEAAEGTPEKEAARKKLEAFTAEKKAIQDEIAVMQADYDAREKEADELSGTKKAEEPAAKGSLVESLAVTNIITDMANNSELAADIFAVLHPDKTESAPKDRTKAVRTYFMNLLTTFANKVKANSMSTRLLERNLRSVSGLNWTTEEIPSMIVQASGKKFLILTNLKKLDKTLEHIETLAGVELALETETDKELIAKYEKIFYKQKAITPQEENSITALLKNNESKYIEAKQVIQKSYMPFVKEYTQFAETKINKKTVTRAAAPQQAGSISMTDRLTNASAQYLAKKKVGDIETYVSGGELLQQVNDFWNKMSSFEGLEVENEKDESLNEANSPETVKGDAQFYISISNSREIAKATKGGNYDENYPTVFVTGKNLKDASEQSAKLFRDWAEPIYKGMHELTNGVNQYFIEDSVAGLSVADSGINSISGQVSKIKETGLQASKLTEEKEIVKNSALDDILSELFD